MLYTISCMHCMTVSLAADGAGLGAMWGEQKAREMLSEAGFTSVEVKQLPNDSPKQLLHRHQGLGAGTGPLPLMLSEPALSPSSDSG